MNRLAVLIAGGLATSTMLAVSIGWNHFIDKPSAVRALRTGAEAVATPPAGQREKPATVVKKPAPAPRAREKATPKEKAPEKSAAPLARTPVAPSFDVVRVEPDGSAVLAGRAAPNVRVDILLDGRVVATVQADSTGAWTYVPDGPLFTDSHQLTLLAHENERAIHADQVLAVSMKPARRGGVPLVLLTTPDAPTKVLQKPAPKQKEAKTAAPRVAQTGQPEKPDRQPATAQPVTAKAEKPAEAAERLAAVEPSAEASPPAAKKSAAGPDVAPGKKGRKAVRPPRTLVLSTVDYDEDGQIFFTGRAEAGAALRLYVDNRHLADVRAGDAGTWEWRGTASIPPGRHALRIDRLTASGRVVERIELPFVREDVRRVAEARAAAGNPALKRKLERRAKAESARQRPATGERQMEAREPAQKAAQRTAAVRQAERQARNGRNGKVQGGLAATVAQVAPRASVAEPAARLSAGREQPAAMNGAAAGAARGQKAAGPKNGLIIVQPGNNLWNISRVIYGRGVRYTTIYDANRDQIRDPDLIYPGQVFRAPGLPSRKLTINPHRKKPLTPEEIEGAPPAGKE